MPACYYCERAGAKTKDHIIPKSLGGPDRDWNLVPACSTCNNDKADIPFETFTGLPRLPIKCVEVGFPTTESFVLFRRQLSAYLGTEFGTKKVKKVNKKKAAPAHTHPAYVSPCLHEPPCRGQDGCAKAWQGGGWRP